MIKILTELDWVFDYYIAPFLYSTNRHFNHMMDKWGERFTSKLD